MWNAEKGRKKWVIENTTCGKEEIQLSLAKKPSLLSELYVHIPINFSGFFHNFQYI
jgi:hypothetical protein